jgi:hypothetical protein
MQKKTAKEMLLTVLENYENLELENMALKALLAGSPASSTRNFWEADLKLALTSPALRARAHEKFAPIYAQISALPDETALLELISRMPLKSIVN